MTVWRRFERTQDGATEYFEIRREGIRCFVRWGSTSRRRESTTVVLLDEDHARRHLDKKIKEWLRKGFTEVAAPAEAEDEPETLVVPTILKMQTKPWFTPEDYLPVGGFIDVVCQAILPPNGTGGFYRYLVLREAGRSAISFNIKQTSHDPARVAAFLDLVTENRDLPFDGKSHHKIPLPQPVGQFSHALFCSAALGRPMSAYPAIAASVASAAPIYDCEIGDADPEVVVDARIHGHGSLNRVDWDRSPQPAFDARFDISSRRRERTFKVYTLGDLPGMLSDLHSATPDSWLEIRRFRGDLKRLGPADVMPGTAREANVFCSP
ncbi:hypothetical protein RMN56_09335 [Micromonospora halotolerans]|uniref:WGR domain-containing protein n=1 Tax=Micromonospora halotolerans TaxID=709879 RepID=A0ABZ0A2A3_9ACTN|nr:hypothetical protein [Micromonospora halotolerans]WNM41522.1 hypothetical protein RMN56_09335 [Micromonospora halotolerans]